MKQFSCFRTQPNMQQNPSAAQREQGRFSCAHFASSCTGMTFISMDTILMVSIFVILAIEVQNVVLCLVLLTVILTILAILAAGAAFYPRIPNEQP
mgnify:CR=1 FL=1